MNPHRESSAFRRVIALAATAIICTGLMSHARADETDQFTLPDREEFADLGPLMTAVHYQVLEDAVEKLNRKIDTALEIQGETQRRARLEHLHSPGAVADIVRAPFGPGFFEMRHLEDALRSQAAKRLHPGKRLAYRTPMWIYFHTHLPFDPRKLVLLFQSSTVKVYGVYAGIDKYGHFHDLGHMYFKDYLARLRYGRSEEDALRGTVNMFARGLLSEDVLIGSFATGVRANADLASNYAGMKFYRNLTEPVMLKGTLHPPLLVRVGDFWALNEHVRPESDFFSAFVSDHFNEALNPCIYEFGMRGPIANQLDKKADRILAFYADDKGRPRPREYFANLMSELETYYGEDYGHTGLDNAHVTIANCCFPDETEAAAGELSPE